MVWWRKELLVELWRAVRVYLSVEVWYGVVAFQTCESQPVMLMLAVLMLMVLRVHCCVGGHALLSEKSMARRLMVALT